VQEKRRLERWIGHMIQSTDGKFSKQRRGGAGESSLFLLLVRDSFRVHAAFRDEGAKKDIVFSNLYIHSVPVLVEMVQG